MSAQILNPVIHWKTLNFVILLIIVKIRSNYCKNIQLKIMNSIKFWPKLKNHANFIKVDNCRMIYKLSVYFLFIFHHFVSQHFRINFTSTDSLKNTIFLWLYQILKKPLFECSLLQKYQYFTALLLSFNITNLDFFVKKTIMKFYKLLFKTLSDRFYYFFFRNSSNCV